MTRTLLVSLSFLSATALIACGNSASTETQSPPAAVEAAAVEAAAKPASATSSATQEIKIVAEPAADNAGPVMSEIEAKGQRLYKRCVTCHTLEVDGRHKVGPNLYGVFGAVAGTKEGFNYSKVMAESGVIWTDENLDAYMAKPRDFMPKNRMSFIGLRKPEDRAAVLAYMRFAMQDKAEE